MRPFSKARDFKEKDLHSILLTLWVNTCSLSIEGKLIPCMEHGLLDVIPIQDFTEMFRRPFMDKDFPLENTFARWFRVYTALQDVLPEWLPISAEEYMAQAYDKMVDILETIRQRNLKKMEVEQEPGTPLVLPRYSTRTNRLQERNNNDTDNYNKI